jgi:hypothetical protein
MSKVVQERADISAAMQAASAADRGGTNVARDQCVWLSRTLASINQRDVLVERMTANVRKEGVARNLVGFHNINVFSLYQLAQVSLSCSPWFCMAWRVVGAAEGKLAAQLQGGGADAARQQ